MSTALEPPSTSTSLGAAVAPGVALQTRALKSTLDELDDEDFRAIGRVLRGATGRQRLVGVSSALGIFVGVTLGSWSGVGGAIVVAVSFAVFIGGRRLLGRGDLAELAFAPALVEVLRPHLNTMHWLNGRNTLNRDEGDRVAGSALVDTARLEQKLLRG